MRNQSSQSLSQRLALLGMFAAVTAALTAVESLLPPLPIPGARLGLANVALMAAMWLTGPVGGVMVGVCKVLFVLLTRGVTAAWMAGCGTLLSLAMTALLLPAVKREKLTFVGVSVAAAGCHTVGQLVCAVWMLSTAVVSYAPLLLVVSTASGTLTGLLLNMVIPRLPIGDRSV